MKKKLSKIILKRGNIVLNVPILTMIKYSTATESLGYLGVDLQETLFEFPG